jgi:hypothetical protein
MKKHKTRNNRGIRIVVYSLIAVVGFFVIANYLINASADNGVTPPPPTGAFSIDDIDRIADGSCKFLFSDKNVTARNQFKIGTKTYNIPYKPILISNVKLYESDTFPREVLFFHLENTTEIGAGTNYYVMLTGDGSWGHGTVDAAGPIYQIKPVFITYDIPDSNRNEPDAFSSVSGTDGKIHKNYIYYANPQNDNVKGKYLNWIQALNRCSLANVTGGSTYQSYDVTYSSSNANSIKSAAFDELNSETNAFITRWYYVATAGWHDINGSVFRSAKNKTQYKIVNDQGYIIYDYNIQQPNTWTTVANSPVDNYKPIGSNVWVSLSADLSFEKALADKSLNLADLSSSKEMTFEIQLDSGQGPFVRKILSNVNDNSTHVIAQFNSVDYVIPILTQSGLDDLYKNDKGSNNPIYAEHKNMLVESLIICAHKGKTTADTAPFINQLFDLKTGAIKQDTGTNNYVPVAGSTINMDAEVTQTLKCGSKEDNTPVQNLIESVKQTAYDTIMSAILNAFKGLAFLIQRAIINVAIWVISNMSSSIPI